MGGVWFDSANLSKYKSKPAVLLYSGGLDSMFTALQLVEAGIEVHALTLDVGQPFSERIQQISDKLGIKHYVIDKKEALCSRYIAKGIQANGLYNGRYPVSSSYTRPLIAEEGVKLAQKIGSTLLIHSATPLQNSSSRFNLSIMALSKEMEIYCPAIAGYISREEKIRRVRQAGLPFIQEYPEFSIDENLWARVLESGTLEDPAQELQEEKVFKWTTDSNLCMAETSTVTIGFKSGVPTSLDHEHMPLSHIISLLNERLGKYGIGRYSGFEDNAFGVKNREVREAPAAHLIHASHLLLEEMILSADELRVKKYLDLEWTRLIVAGGWFSPLKHSLDVAIDSMNQDIVGELTWRIKGGAITCISQMSPYSLCSSAFAEFPDEFAPYTLEQFYNQLSRKQRTFNY